MDDSQNYIVFSTIPTYLFFLYLWEGRFKIPYVKHYKPTYNFNGIRKKMMNNENRTIYHNPKENGIRLKFWLILQDKSVWTP